MNQIVPAVRYTTEEFERFPEEGYELIDGKPVEKAMSMQSALVGGNLYRLLANYAAGRNIGWAFPADLGYVKIFPRDPNRVRKPDVSFLRRERIPDGKLSRGWCRVAPDLAVEVVSANELTQETTDRVVDYLEAGVPLVWVVDPDTRMVQIFRPNGTGAWVLRTGELSGEEALPGFSCRVEDLFTGL